MLSRPKHAGRRCEEVLSGFAAAEAVAVLAELHSPRLSSEAERQRFRDPRLYVAPLVISGTSSVGIFYLARCIGIARCGHVAHSMRNRVLGVSVAVPYFLALACSSIYYRFAPALEESLCPREDTPFAASLRARGSPLARGETRGFLDACERRLAASGEAAV
mmetsp:Transcript_135006/g.419531  ORF Transcript_135006/g.419531 Transcript_135006/m.419531 type:complete len:162 (+) Transcript_135006:40-525(+)